MQRPQVGAQRRPRLEEKKGHIDTQRRMRRCRELGLSSNQQQEDPLK